MKVKDIIPFINCYHDTITIYDIKAHTDDLYIGYDNCKSLLNDNRTIYMINAKDERHIDLLVYQRNKKIMT